MMRPSEVGVTYLNRDGLHKVIELARHADNGDIVVVYRRLSSKEVFARPLSTWEAEEFVRMPDNVGQRIDRFRRRMFVTNMSFVNLYKIVGSVARHRAHVIFNDVTTVRDSIRAAIEERMGQQ